MNGEDTNPWKAGVFIRVRLHGHKPALAGVRVSCRRTGTGTYIQDYEAGTAVSVVRAAGDTRQGALKRLHRRAPQAVRAEVEAYMIRCGYTVPAKLDNVVKSG